MNDDFAGFMELYGELFVAKLKAELQKSYPFRGGSANKIAGVGYGFPTDLYNSIESVYNPSTQELSILMNEYWRYVNDGRQPGKYVPIKPLMLWAMSPLRLGLDQQEAKKAAFGISTNIKKFGIEPTYFYDNAYASLAEQLEGELFNEIGLSIEDFISRTIEESIGFNTDKAQEQIIQAGI